MADARDVLGPGHEERAGLLEADAFLELQGAHGRHGAEVPVEGGGAHAGETGEVLDPQGLGVVVTDPVDGPADVGQAAVGQADLTDHGAVGAGEQPPEDLPLDHRGEHGGVRGVVEQPQQPHDGVEEVGSGLTGRDRGWGGRGSGPAPGRCLQQQRGDGGRAQDQPHAQRGVPRAHVHVVAGDRQDRGDHEVLPRPVVVHLVAEQQALAAPGHDDQQRFGQRVVRRGRRHP